MSQDHSSSLDKPIAPPILVLAFGILSVSTASIFIRFAQDSASSIIIAAYRNAFSALILAPIAFLKYRQEIKNLSIKQFGWLALSGIFLAFHFASWIISLEYTTVTASVVLVTTTPLWVGILSPLFLRERITRLLVMGLIVALAGGFIVGIGGECEIALDGISCPSLKNFFQGRAFLGNFLALVGAWLASAYIMIGKKVRTSISLISYTFLVYGVSAVVLTSIAILTQQEVFGYEPDVYLLFLALAVFPQLLGHSVFNWALRYLSATYVSIALLGEPIGSTVLALILLGETPAILEIVGGVLILAGIFLASLSQPRRE